MNDYDLLVLSPIEFENLSRDLLQKKLDIYFESFTSGADGGIDLRHANSSISKLIVQAKRIENYSKLKGNLKKEIEKVKQMKPTRYILTTTVGLTPLNKDEILEMFHPYILDTEDIFGKNDLNNLLGQNRDIEFRYNKLWLSSSNILEKVLHSKIYNQTAFELEEMKEDLKLYVQNESFDKAISVLDKNKYVIISGLPGVGKTTLARFIVLNLLSNDYEEFIYLGQSIDNGTTLFNDERKQVFFFDDFLGRSFFTNSESTSDIIKFIRKINRSHDKILILASREYILNEAKVLFEEFSVNDLDANKCIIDLSLYTNLVKAQILYNHLFFAKIPLPHISNLIETGMYLELVKHKNYNPRIIETIVNGKVWKDCRPENFSGTLFAFFENPESVWLVAFNSLKPLPRYSLLVLLTMGNKVLIENWSKAVREFVTKNNNQLTLSFDETEFDKTIRILENTFIRTQKDGGSKIAVEFQNPSIQDFLVHYLSDKKDYIRCLLESAIFIDQYFSIYTTSSEDNFSNKNKVKLDKVQIELALEKLDKSYEQLESCEILRLSHSSGNSFSWWPMKEYYYESLKKIYREFQGICPEMTLSFVCSKFQKKIYLQSGDHSEQKDYIFLLTTLDLTKFEFDEDKILQSFFSNIYWVENLELFEKLKGLFPDAFENFSSDKNILLKIEDIVKREVKDVKEDGAADLITNIRNVSALFDVYMEEEITELQLIDTSYMDGLDSKENSNIESRNIDEKDNPIENEDKSISDMFSSLIIESEEEDSLQ